MRFFLLFLFLFAVPHGAYPQKSDSIFSHAKKQLGTNQPTYTSPWLHQHGNKDPLSQNQPNPASSYTIIYFYVAQSGPVSLKLYDARGKLIGYFVDGPGTGGTTYRVLFPVNFLAAGEYFYCFMTSEFSIVKKMVVVK